MLRLFLVFAFFVCILDGFATEVDDKNFRETVLRCKITTNDGAHHIPKPKKFHRSNNLTRRSKDIFFSRGESMIIEGYVLDKNCVPITNASLQIWQPNNYGLYQNEMKAKDLSNNHEKLKIYDTHFASNGSNSSDNTGFYRFILIKPCKDCQRKIDMSVKHKNFSNLEKVVWIGMPSKEDLINANRNSHVSYRRNSGGKSYFGYELQEMCGYDEEIINESKVVVIRTGGSFAKYIGKRGNQDVYRFDVVLPGREEYRKY